MVAGTEKEQSGLGYGHKIMMEVGVYFKQKIQSNILLWPNSQFAIDPCNCQHLYTYKRVYLVWCFWLILEESGAILVSQVPVGLKRMIEESV